MNLEDIAKLAGVSRSTVSRVINDDPRVSDAVRERVREVIAETNYRPNAAARSLASRRSRVIALLIPQSMREVFRDAWFPVMIQGCMDGCAEADLSLTLLMESSTEPATVERLIERTVRSHLIDGLIISTALHDDVLCARLMDERFPFVCIGQDERFSHSFVDIDNQSAARMATEHLIAHGYQRIGMIGGHPEIVAAESRQRGFYDALDAAGLPHFDDQVRHGDFNEHRAFAAALAMLSAPVRPQAIFAASDAMAVGTLRAAQSLGLRVPEDLALVGFDGLEEGLLESHALTTIRQPAREIGKRAVELLAELIADSTRTVRHDIFPVSMYLGTSCGGHPAPASARDAGSLLARSAVAS